jgi:hypothetical protein
MRFSSLTIEKQLHYLNILKILSIECKNLIKTDEMGYFTRDEILRLFNHNMTILFFYSELLYSDALIEEDEYKKVSKTIKEYEKDYDGKYRILTLEEKFKNFEKILNKIEKAVYHISQVKNKEDISEEDVSYTLIYENYLIIFDLIEKNHNEDEDDD